MRYISDRLDRIVFRRCVYGFIFNHKQEEEEMGVIIRRCVEHGIRLTVFDGVDNKVSNRLRSWWGVDHFINLSEFDRYLVTSSILGEL
jgi:hypothetical protein